MKINKNLIRYLVVGGTAYVIEISTLAILKYGVNLSAVRSVAISFWVGLISAFLLQKAVTFKNYERTHKALARQVFLYGLLVAWNYLFTLFIVKLFASSVSVIIVRTVIIALVTCWNFPLYKKIFRTEQI